MSQSIQISIYRISLTTVKNIVSRRGVSHQLSVPRESEWESVCLLVKESSHFNRLLSLLGFCQRDSLCNCSIQSKGCIWNYFQCLRRYLLDIPWWINISNLLIWRRMMTCWYNDFVVATSNNSLRRWKVVMSLCRKHEQLNFAIIHILRVCLYSIMPWACF